ncbi:MAG TPA: EamA family transporter [Candidatus Angelobacter sp.]|nr:EamA family transporter [Candidatus Angelobacter sp.]
MAGPLTRAQLLGFAALCVIWGSTWLAIRLVVREVPPLDAAAIRFFAGAILLLTIAVAQKRRWPAGEKQWNALLVLSVTIMAVPYGLLFWAEQYVSSSMTAVLFSGMPLLVSLFTPLLLRRSVPRRALLALLVGFGGLLLLFPSGLSASSSALLGGIAILLAVILSAWSIVYAKYRLQDVDPVVATGIQLLFGSVVLFWGTWALEAHSHALWTRTAVLALSFLVLFGSCAAFVIYYWLLKRMQPYQLATTSLITPVIAVLEGALFAHEAVPLLMVIAMAVVLGSVGTVLLSSQQQQSETGKVLLVQE